MKYRNRKIFYIVIVLSVISTASLSALDGTRWRIGVSAGLTLDVAPFGIERKYISIQGEITTPGTISFSLLPSCSLHDESQMLRFPLVIRLNAFPGEENIFILSVYAGAGAGFKFEGASSVFSPIITGGAKFFFHSFSIEIPIIAAYGNGQFDTDIGFLLGYSFNFGGK